MIALPRQEPVVETFARHMAADAKILDEDETTGVQKYRYVRLGENHFSMAFTYCWLASGGRAYRRNLRGYIRSLSAEE